MKYIIIASLLLFPQIIKAQNSYIKSTLKGKVPITAVAISPNGQNIYVGFEDGAFAKYNADTFEEVYKIEKEQKQVLDIEVSPDGNTLYVASGTKTQIYNTNGEHIGVWAGHMTPIWSMELSKDNKMMVSAGISSTFNLRNVENGKIIAQLRGHEKPAMAVAFSPDAKLIASGGSDYMVHLWNVKSQSVIADLHGHSNHIYDVAFSPNGQLIAACSYDKSIRIWDVKEHHLIHLLQGHRDAVMEIEFSPDGKYLLSASSDFSIKLWDVESGEELHAYLENESTISDIAFFPDGKTFVSASYDQNIKIWQLHPEIWALKFFKKEYEAELAKNVLFLPKKKGEKKGDYETRVVKAEKLRFEIAEKYYQQWLTEE